ncbi:hypothetical protein NQ315_016496 [Exocentrus adspersus]|uniref:Uncharacterized protein n=1 Tax=Exocentrus adspersus TaxID=1586481 RepID=A0AAV8VYL6_9CUCU|nr:hypothetical protein NQ315_016496 [Exocentrus adspersus]
MQVQYKRYNKTSVTEQNKEVIGFKLPFCNFSASASRVAIASASIDEGENFYEFNNTKIGAFRNY